MIARVGILRGGRRAGLSAPAWYVDSAAGSDNNNGTSAARPLQSIAAALQRLRPGDTIALARGSHWRESLNLPFDNATVRAYGSGPMPLLDCSDPVAPETWLKTDGQQNIYQGVVALDGTDVAQFVSVWENDVRLVRASSLAECDATPGSYCTSSDTLALITLYVHASDDSNPFYSLKTYEYSRRPFGLVGHNGLIVTGIRTRRNLHNNGSLSVYADARLTDCVASEGSKHNVYCGPGSVLTNVEADRSYFTSDAMMFVHNGAAVGGADVTFINCYAHDSSGSTAAGFGGHSNDGSAFGTVTWQGCRVVNCTRSFMSYNSGRTVALDCTATPATEPNGPALFTDSPEVTVSGCVLSGRTGNGRAIQTEAAGADVIIRGCTLGGNIPLLVQGADTTITLQNNTIATDGLCVYVNGANGTLHITGNSFSGPSLYYYCERPPALVDSDYNTFISPGDNPRFEMPGGTRWNLAGWKAIGHDVHSTP